MSSPRPSSRPASAASPTSTTATSTSRHHDRPGLDTRTDPPSAAGSDLLASPSALISAIAYPVSYTLSGLLRRISVDEAPTPLAKALSANYNGSMTDASPGAYIPPPPGPGPGPGPRGTGSPFQPPALTPLTLSGYRDSTRGSERLLNRSLAEEIRLLVPARIQLVDQWSLVYSLEQDGASLNRLFALSEKHQGKRCGFVLVVRDGSGMVFGAYLSDAPHPSPSYFGTGECFLWRAFRLASMPDFADLPPLPSEDTTHATRVTTIAAAGFSHQNSSTSLSSLNGTPANGTRGTGPEIHGRRTASEPDNVRIRFKAFPYAGENDYTILCSSDFLALGGGNGKYGLWLDDRLAKGISGHVPTFMNECLSEEGEKFDVLGVELWYLGS